MALSTGGWDYYFTSTSRKQWLHISGERVFTTTSTPDNSTPRKYGAADKGHLPFAHDSNNTGNEQHYSEGTNSTKIPPYCSSCDDNIYLGTGDNASMILAGHNRERAALGVAPLVWSNELASRAQAWVNYNLAHGTFTHCNFVKGKQQIEPCKHDEGENGAARNHCAGYMCTQTGQKHVTYGNYHQPRCRRVGSPKIPPIIGCR